jgi:hypothetical protein
MLIGLVVANYISNGLSMIYISRNLKYKLKQQFFDILPSFLVSVCITIAIFSIKGLLPRHTFLELLIFQLVIALILYFLIIYIFYNTLYQKIKTFIIDHISIKTNNSNHNDNIGI